MTKSKNLRNLLIDVSKIVEPSELVAVKLPVLQTRITIDRAVDTIIRQMELVGYRPITLKDYRYHMSKLQELANVTYLDEIDRDAILRYLDAMNVSNSTKNIRLKCVKAVLEKCFDNRWIDTKFWKSIHIRLDKKVKEATAKEDLKLLLTLIDVTTFIGLRDTVAILLIYKTGIRINTLINLEESHIDFEQKMLLLDGSIMKNRTSLKLPLDHEMLRLLRALIKENERIKTHYNETNALVFVSSRGTHTKTPGASSSGISKQLSYYSKEYGLKNINAHALRRAYATNLLRKGANIALISKALGHSDLSVTTQYLDINEDEVVANLKEFM